jgi:D-proline reductase (dithiol) PrdB
MGDTQVRTAMSTIPVPNFETTAFTIPRLLSKCTVALITTAGLRHSDQPDWGFRSGDQSFRILDSANRSLILSHTSQNFDRTGFIADPNVVFPLDRLHELAAAGAIERVATRHLAFIGNQDETMATLRLDSGPTAAKLLREDGVDVVFLTPV